ncbi:hypothetical protein BO70DRAFT_353970 [Aspergillus heteromorphus CBS 117.55]|uniref:Uncharacterized protein n=1 Tax=Aspergillus heteromorphus CBS 117.55 TaxID=1448321 RepID=A0A317VX40_9EURO|nr:uncharacterized protein BO70DRAFT_353970 [Aspergillus heteromorphus CBS 117.55]PWY77542.1 hypothetical protein BO70DRAFT_353970 [Aspergillus heteromorphus CBS 117.55]
MDLQGQPIPSGQRSTKVTTDPTRHTNPIHEPAGPVLNDSLAAESATHGGTFAQNRGSEPMGVSSGQSTTRTTNTSGATKLDSNADFADKYPEGLGGQGNYPGAHGSGYVGGPTGAKKELGIHAGEYPASQKLSQSQSQGQGQGRQAPASAASGSGYSSLSQSQGYGSAQPKGRGLKEGDVPDDAPNASYTTDIGGENDPGRVAQGGFQRRNVESGPAGTAAGRQKGVDDQQWYQHLQSDQRA